MHYWGSRLREQLTVSARRRLPLPLAIIVAVVCIVMMIDAWLAFDLGSPQWLGSAILAVASGASVWLALRKPMIGTLIFAVSGAGHVALGAPPLYIVYVGCGFTLVIGMVSTVATIACASAIVSIAVIFPAVVCTSHPADAIAPVALVFIPILVCSLVLALREDRVAVAERRRAEAERMQREVRQRERQSLARTMHDDVGHALTVMSMVAASRKKSSDMTKLREALVEIESHARSALVDMRMLLQVLREENIDAPVSQELALPRRSSYSDDVTVALNSLDSGLRSLGFDVTGTAGGELASIAPLHSESIVRIVQEAYANIAKYASLGSMVNRMVHVDQGNVVLEILSPFDGAGRSATGPHRTDTGSHRADEAHAQSAVSAGSTHYGVLGIHERVRLLNGRVKVGPEGRAWVVRASWPARERA